ncbi:MAG: hypothetical protein V7K75_19040, partial [Nostoc sp.]
PIGLLRHVEVHVCDTPLQASPLSIPCHLNPYAITSIRGMVEIEQAERDRSLERTIQVLGIAFGGGAIVSGVVTQHIDKPFAPQINFKYPVHPLVLSLLWSVLATVVFAMVAWLVTKPKPQRTKS